MPDEVTTPDTGDAPNTADLQAEVDKWKALSRQWEARAKQSKAELDKIQGQAEGVDHSDMEKLRATVDQLRNDLVEERRKAMVAEIARERGLSAAQAKRLKGNTREELEADADDIVEAFGIKKPDMGDAGNTGQGKQGDKPNETGEGKGGEGKGGDKPGGLGVPMDTLRPGAAGPDSADDFDADAIAKKVLEQPL